MENQDLSSYLLEGTSTVVEAKVHEFIKVYVNDLTRNYNNNEIIVKDDCYLLSGVLDCGVHNTYLLTKDDLRDHYSVNSNEIALIEFMADICKAFEIALQYEHFTTMKNHIGCIRFGDIKW
jgi:hypothetical protein